MESWQLWQTGVDRGVAQLWWTGVDTWQLWWTGVDSGQLWCGPWAAVVDGSGPWVAVVEGNGQCRQLWHGVSRSAVNTGSAVNTAEKSADDAARESSR